MKALHSLLTRRVTQTDWEIDPPGLVEVLTRVQRQRGALPCYVTDGSASPDEVTTDGAVLHDAYAADLSREMYDALGRENLE